MINWQAGDMALCVVGGHISSVRVLSSYPVKNMIYPVSEVRPTTFVDGDRHIDDIGLVVQGAPNNSRGEPLWIHTRFRKLKPLELTEEDMEVIEAMKGSVSA